MLEGFTASPPAIFVFCGRFLTLQEAQNYTEACTKAFQNLLVIFRKHSINYVSTQFIFVPAIEDICPMDIWPR